MGSCKKGFVFGISERTIYHLPRGLALPTGRWTQGLSTFPACFNDEIYLYTLPLNSLTGLSLNSVIVHMPWCYNTTRISCMSMGQRGVQ